MGTTRLSALLAAVAVVGLGCPGPDNPTDPVTAWTAVLSGADEVPAVTTTAAGTASFALASATSLNYTINLSTIPATAITQAHIHTGNAGASGGVSVWMCGTAANPGPTGTPACTTLAAPGVLISGTVTVTAALVTSMRAFGTYVNVHTATNTGGEIRGQLRIVPP